MLLRSLLFFTLLVLFQACKQQKDKPKIIPKISSQDDYLRYNPDSGVRIFFTFDDGPYETTPQLTSLLSQLKLKSSFFIVGSQIDYSQEYDSIFKATRGDKHFKIYNHTYSHAVTKGRIHHYYSRPERVWEDISRNKEYILTGGTITRLPGKNTWKIGDYVRNPDYGTSKLIAYLDKEKKEEAIVGWDVEWKLKHSLSLSEVDSLVKEIATIISKDTSRKKEIVVLSHDYLYRIDSSLQNFTYFVNKLKEIFQPSYHWVEELELINTK